VNGFAAMGHEWQGDTAAQLSEEKQSATAPFVD
jgi:hypothetical protein